MTGYISVMMVIVVIGLVIPALSSTHPIDKQRVETQKYISKPTWSLFTNSSYHYILGLFYQPYNPIFADDQTPAMFMSAILLSQQYNMTINGKQFAYHLEIINGYDPIEALDHVCLAINKKEILGIVGPTQSSQTRTISRFSNRVGLPVMGYAASDPEISDRNAYRTFYRMTPSDILTAKALLKLFQNYSWTSTNLIYQGDNYGQGGRLALMNTFNNQINISREIKYDLFTNQIDQLRRHLKESPSRIVIIWANADITTRIIRLALQEGDILGPSFLWIFTALNSLMQLNDKQLTGMLLIRSVTGQAIDVPNNITLLQDAVNIWKTNDPQSYPGDEMHIDNYALFAFDSAWSLILAFQELCRQKPNNCPSLINSSYCFDSQLTDQAELHKILRNIDFLGVSGRVQFSENTTDRLMTSGSYFIIDNLQPLRATLDELYAVEVLKINSNTSAFTRDSITRSISTLHPIIWPSGSDKAPADYALLKNQPVNITVYVSSPFFMEENNTNNNEIKRSGYIYDLISLLTEHAGWDVTLTVAPISASYDELAECVENHTYEIVMADLTRTPSRSERIDFSVSIYDNYLRLVVRKSKAMLTPWYAFILPFHGYVWLVIGITFVVSVILIYLYEKVEGKFQVDRETPDIIERSRLKSLLNASYHTIGAIAQRDGELRMNSFGGRGHTVLLWLTSIYLMSLLTSSMTTYFIAKQNEPWIQSVDELKMCGKIDCNRIGVMRNSHHYDYFLRQLMDGNPMNHYDLKNPNECYDKLLHNYIDVAIADSSSAEYFTQTKQYCELEVVGFPFSKTDFAVAMPKGWQFKQDLDRYLMELKENGSTDGLLEKYFQKKICNSEGGANSDNNRLQLEQVYGLFIVLSVLAIVILAISVFKWCCIDRKRSKSNPSDGITTPQSLKTDRRSSSVNTNLSMQTPYHQPRDQLPNCDPRIQNEEISAVAEHSQELMLQQRRNISPDMTKVSTCL